ncbi:hypothetical protein M011DRAFT_485798 [Sporormia fimetaria CBS 119925]|uniref:Uncharacterized protein n=1 Tax=Sporormia fimetaria CBS 119925 TaxID=1340428 RepID=A0A6A6VG42_9PLEO|nr:hypothetical protein M011DRAFT_485798 [Sporormia fimetaria CBS 119925]
MLHNSWEKLYHRHCKDLNMALQRANDQVVQLERKERQARHELQRVQDELQTTKTRLAMQETNAQVTIYGLQEENKRLKNVLKDVMTTEPPHKRARMYQDPANNELAMERAGFNAPTQPSTHASESPWRQRTHLSSHSALPNSESEQHIRIIPAPPTHLSSPRFIDGRFEVNATHRAHPCAPNARRESSYWLAAAQNYQPKPGRLLNQRHTNPRVKPGSRDFIFALGVVPRAIHGSSDYIQVIFGAPTRDPGGARASLRRKRGQSGGEKDSTHDAHPQRAHICQDQEMREFSARELK